MIWPHLSCRMSRVIVAPELRGHGIHGAMVTRAVAIGFDVHHVDRIDFGVFSDIAPAIACYQRQGFSPVDVWPAAFRTRGVEADVLGMRLTRARWAGQLLPGTPSDGAIGRPDA
jgi:RimJ/RimL family protein N-acetyltransferase